MTYTKNNAGVRDVADYIASQQAKGWPGSRSIRGRPILGNRNR